MARIVLLWLAKKGNRYSFLLLGCYLDTVARSPSLACSVCSLSSSGGFRLSVPIAAALLHSEDYWDPIFREL